MNTSKVLEAEIRDALRKASNRSSVVPMQAYMRGQFVFLGVPTPQRRAVTLPQIRALQPDSSSELLAAAKTLWNAPEREFQYVAIDLLNSYRQQLGAKGLPALLSLARQKSWWDSVDPLASLVGGVVRRYRPSCAEMDRSISSKNLWVRRIAMLHQLGWRAETDTERLWAYAERLGPEEDFFIRKAIGWALRDYARHNPEAVRAFLHHTRVRLSPLSVREALRHMTSPSRRQSSDPAGRFSQRRITSAALSSNRRVTQ